VDRELAPALGDATASKIPHHAMNNDLTLKAGGLKRGFVTEVEFDRVVDPTKIVSLCRYGGLMLLATRRRKR